MAAKDQMAGRARLIDHLQASQPAILEVAASDTGLDWGDLEPSLKLILAMVAESGPGAANAEAFEKDGARAARRGIAGDRVLDGYLSLNWAIWEAAVPAPGIDHAVILDLADRLMHGIDTAIAAVTRRYVLVEVELAAAHSERRRSVLEELLTARRATPEDRARIRRRAEPPRTRC